MNRIIPFISLAVCVSQNTWAELPMRSSSDFENRYEADTLPDAAEPAWLLSREGEGNHAEVRDGVLQFTSVGDVDETSHLMWVLHDPFWADFPRHLGFTIEIRVKPEHGKSLGLNFAATENVGAGYAVLRIHESLVTWTSGTNETSIELCNEDNSSDFHTYRLIKLPSDGDTPGLFRVYRDGKLIGDELEGAYPHQPMEKNRFYFGDVGSWDSAGEIDYVRWEKTGAYDPQ